MSKYLLRFIFIASGLGASNIVLASDMTGGLTLKENFELAKKFPMPSPWLLSAQCSACHGTMGTAFDEIIPPLAGMDKQDFIDKMQEYKTADASNFIVMGIIAQPITDEEIEAMAGYFAKLKPEPLNQDKAPNDVVVPDWAVMKKESE